ncbi:MAG: hypothetical protein K2L54_02710 [Clostridiales bacterium]|nr:hypothetical protein [Clostridiales bacterium]
MKTVANSMTYAITRTPDKLCATLRTTRGELFISKVIASLALIIQQPPIDIPINDPLFDRVDR